MATPIQFLPVDQVNSGNAAIDDKVDSSIIGLSNGNILVIATERDTTGNGTIAPSPGFDIVGTIFDAKGEIVRDSFQLNTTFVINDEQKAVAAATSDGGFIIAFESRGNINVGIRWERFDSAGNQTDNGSIASASLLLGSSDVTEPAIAYDATDDSFVVVFTRFSNIGDPDIKGVRVDSSGNAGPEFQASQNSGDEGQNGDVAVLANGNYVSVFEEVNGANGIEAAIFTPNGTLIRGPQVSASGEDPKVASLANGNFVVTWESGNDILARIFTPTGDTVTTFAVATGGNSQTEPSIVALPEGGFVIAWDNNTTTEVEARKFNANGTPDGATFIVGTTPTSNPTAIDTGVTADGRLLFTFGEAGGNRDIFAAVWDPRDQVMDNNVYTRFVPNFVVNDGPLMGSILDDIMTGTNESEEIHGLGGNDTINAAEGDDTVNGGDGNDSIEGGDGNDTIDGGTGNDTINAGIGFDEVKGGIGADLINGLGGFDMLMGEGGFDSINGNAGDDSIQGGGGNDTVDGGIGADEINGGIGFDLIFGKGGNDIIVGLDGFDTLQGNNGNDSIQGNAGNDLIFGGLGNDTIDGGIGADTLHGDAGADLISGKAGFDVLFGGNGDDTLFGNAGNDTLHGGAGNDTLFGGVGSDAFVFVPRAGERDVIGDFEVGSDRIVVDVAPGTSFNVQVTAIAGGIEASALGHTIFFAGLTAAQVEAINVELI